MKGDGRNGRIGGVDYIEYNRNELFLGGGDPCSAATRAKVWLQEWSLQWRTGEGGCLEQRRLRSLACRAVQTGMSEQSFTKKYPYLMWWAATFLLCSILFCFVMHVIKWTS